MSLDIPHDVEDQEELPQPIKVNWTGRLRGRIQERHWDYAATKDGDEWVVSDDADPKAAAVYRALTRQKTNVVIKTVEEAYAFYSTMGHYRAGGGHEGITWMNGMMVKVAKRVSDEVLEEMRAMGYEPQFERLSYGRTLRGFGQTEVEA